jgi:hypothetical protein
LVVVGFAAGAIEKVSHRLSRKLALSRSGAEPRLHDLQIPANLILLKNIAVIGVHWVSPTRSA